MDNKFGPVYGLSGVDRSERSPLFIKRPGTVDSRKSSDDAENVVVVKPTKTETEPTQERDNNSSIEAEGKAHQQPDPHQARDGNEVGGQSVKETAESTVKHNEGGSSLTAPPEPSDSYVRYNRILVPHDGSATSDKALNHAIYLSLLSGAEIVILHVVEHMNKMSSSAFTATSKEGGSSVKDGEKSNKVGEFDITIEGEVKHMIEEKMNFCKQAGVKSQLSYKIQTGKPVEEIVKSAEDMNVDLIVMASTRSSSLAKRILGSTSRKVLDGVKKPSLIVQV